MAPPAGAKDDGGVDHVGHTFHTTELTRLTRPLVVERFDLNLSGAKQASQARLTPPIPPRLTHDPCRHRQRIANLEGAHEESNYGSVIALESNERARVQRESAHRRPLAFRAGFLAMPRARSATRRSVALEGTA